MAVQMKAAASQQTKLFIFTSPPHLPPPTPIYHSCKYKCKIFFIGNYAKKVIPTPTYLKMELLWSSQTYSSAR